MLIDRWRSTCGGWESHTSTLLAHHL